MKYTTIIMFTCALFCAHSLTTRINACPINFDTPSRTTNPSPKKSHENTELSCTQSCAVHCAKHTQEQAITDIVGPDIKHVSVTPDY